MTDFNILVEGASKYSFTDRDSGRLVEGVNVFHMIEAENENQLGQIPSKITLPIESWNYLVKFNYPCTCSLVTKQILGKKGIITKVIGLKEVK